MSQLEENLPFINKIPLNAYLKPASKMIKLPFEMWTKEQLDAFNSKNPIDQEYQQIIDYCINHFRGKTNNHWWVKSENFSHYLRMIIALMKLEESM